MSNKENYSVFLKTEFGDCKNNNLSILYVYDVYVYYKCNYTDSAIY